MSEYKLGEIPVEQEHWAQTSSPRWTALTSEFSTYNQCDIATCLVTSKYWGSLS